MYNSIPVHFPSPLSAILPSISPRSSGGNATYPTLATKSIPALLKPKDKKGVTFSHAALSTFMNIGLARGEYSPLPTVPAFG